MTDITRSLLSSAALFLEWDTLGRFQREDELRLVFMGAFLHAREAHLSLILLPEATPPAGFDKRLDLYLLPAWPPYQKALAAGEIKFFPKGRPTDYRTRIGSRLSDIHYVHSLASEGKLHGFFFDIVLDRKLVGNECYESLKDMCKLAADAMYNSANPTPPDQLKDLDGVKAFATASIDHTPRKLLRRTPYGFLFPPMDLPGGKGSAKRGPAFVKSTNEEGLISIGVRKAGKEQVVPYRAFTSKDRVDGAVCFAVFEPGGSLAANTDDLIASLANR
jgi:hypothetical protein